MAAPAFLTLDAPNETATAAIAAALAPLLKASDAVALEGPLGAGKTAFARALIRARVGDPALEVPSPTFTLVQPYEAHGAAPLAIHHFDLYRLGSPDELDELGFEDALVLGAVLVEWPERAGDQMPDTALRLRIAPGKGATARRLAFAGGAGWAARLKPLARQFDSGAGQGDLFAWGAERANAPGAGGEGEAVVESANVAPRGTPSLSLPHEGGGNAVAPTFAPPIGAALGKDRPDGLLSGTDRSGPAPAESPDGRAASQNLTGPSPAGPMRGRPAAPPSFPPSSWDRDRTAAAHGATPGTVPRVFTIPPGVPFLPTLVAALRDGTLVPSWSDAGDPLKLADATIFVPTRRAARELRGVIVGALGGPAALLPQIRPLGDPDEDDDIFAAGPGDALELPPAVSPTERLLLMTRLVHGYLATQAAAAERAGLHPRRQPAAAAVLLARELLRLMDQVAAEEADWAALARLVPDEFAGHWQASLTFLGIAADAWPRVLAERGVADPIARRGVLIDRLAARLAANPPAGPVIAAGSTGSVPATARLIATIARLPLGAAVLPGLVRDLDQLAWDAIDGESPAPSHPQAGMKRLIGLMRIDRADVAPLGAPTPALVARSRLVAEAMRPADVTDVWAAAAADPAALDGVDLLVAADEAEEALAVAVALRDAIATPGRTAALVTPDRGLARRVAAELARFEIRVDDSAGVPLDRTPVGVLARLVADVALGGAAVGPLLALLKHPLARFGAGPSDYAARSLELLVLRGPALAPGTAAVLAMARRIASEEKPKDGERFGRGRFLVGSRGRVAAIELAERLTAALVPLEKLAAERTLPFSALLEAHVAAVRAVARGSQTEGGLVTGRDGETMASLLAGLMEAEERDFLVAPAEYPAMIAALMAGRLVRPPPGADPRVHIWGTLEARLLTVDRIVLGGLVEGVWPAATRTDPWLSRPMRAGLALDPPERRIGLAAHDFASALGTAEVVLSRPERRGGAPTVPSRWLQRLMAVAGKPATKAMEARGRRFLDWAAGLDTAPAERIGRPNPKPPIDVRPRSLSVTEIEKWVRDPYAIYARRILKLDELDPPGRMPDYATRGILVHGILSDFAKEWSGAYGEAAIERLIAIGRRHFEAIEAYPAVHAAWWPRFLAVARFVVRAFEAPRAAFTVRRHAEVKGTLAFPTTRGGFTLTGRADRIDRLSDGRLAIIDFKTGRYLPTPKQLKAFLAPQLPLEAAMAMEGGFEGIPSGMPAELVYVVLRGAADEDRVTLFESPDRPLAEVIAVTRGRLAALIAAYERPEQGYLSRAQVFKERRFDDPYDHLARVREWSAGEEADA